MISNRWQYAVAAVLIILLVGEVLWYAPITKSKPGSFKILGVVRTSAEAENTVSITYQLFASLPLDATVVITPIGEFSQDLPVYVFYDTDYPTVATDWTFVAMLQAHLNAELRLRGYSNETKLANAAELEDIFIRKEPAVVIMASGAFPSNLLSKETNLVKPWVDAGGVLVWFGFYIGYYIVEKGMKSQDITDNMTQNLREDGSRELGLDGFFEYLEMKDQPTVATYPSPISDALQINYDLIQQAPLLDMVWAKNGLVLGKTGGENPSGFRSSVSIIPMGVGKIVIFGFFLMESLTLNGPELAAWDLAQILCSGVLQMKSDSVQYCQSYSLTEQETKNDTALLTLKPGITGFVVFEYTSQRSNGVLFHRDFVSEGEGS
jgi:hypothetical protein